MSPWFSGIFFGVWVAFVVWLVATVASGYLPDYTHHHQTEYILSLALWAAVGRWSGVIAEKRNAARK